MRVGLIADIHGNLLALETVLAELERESLDHLVCLGDVAALGPRPAAVIARLRQLDCPTVLGNTDAWLLGDDAPDANNAALTAWAVAQLSDADHRYLRDCPLTYELALDEPLTLLCCHGSPRSYDEVIAAGTAPAELAAMLGDRRPAILAGGHTHRQLVRRDGDLLFVNPGSVGLPGVGPSHPLLELSRAVAWAEYAVLDAAAGGLRVELRRVPLDLDHLFADARASGMPDLAWWLDRWARP